MTDAARIPVTPKRAVGTAVMLLAGLCVMASLPLRAETAPAEADPDRVAGVVWTGMLDRCLAMMDKRVLVPSMGKGWRPDGFGQEIGGGGLLRHYIHRQSGAKAQLVHYRAERQVRFCGSSVFRHFPASQVEAATLDWAAAETEAGRLRDTGRLTGPGRDLEPVEGLVWTYQWCGPEGAGAEIRLEMSEFPPARMDIYRNDRCVEES